MDGGKLWTVCLLECTETNEESPRNRPDERDHYPTHPSSLTSTAVTVATASSYLPHIIPAPPIVHSRSVASQKSRGGGQVVLVVIWQL